MAKMPQIPPIEFGARPEGRVENAVLPSISEGGAAAEIGAKAIDDLSNFSSRLEQARQVAADKKQAILDETTALEMRGKFQAQLRAHSDTFSTAFAQTPDKAPDAHLAVGRQLMDDMMNNAPTQGAALHFMKGAQEDLNASMAKADGWKEGRLTLNAKNYLQTATNEAAAGARAQTSLDGLTFYANRKLMELKPLHGNLTGDEGAARESMAREMSKSWVESFSLDHPLQALNALDAKKGFLVEHLTGEDREHLRSRAEMSLHNIGSRHLDRVVREGIDLNKQAAEAYLNGDLTPAVVSARKNELDQKEFAVNSDPSMKPNDPMRAAQVAAINLQRQNLDQLDVANRKQQQINAVDEPAANSKMLADYAKLYAEPTHKAIAQFQHDLAKVHAQGEVSGDTVQTLNESLALGLPKQLGKSGAGLFGVFSHQSAWQAGYKSLDQFFDAEKPLLGAMTLSQQNKARLKFIVQLNGALKAGTPINVETAKAMAVNAAYFAAGRVPPGGRK